MTVRKIIFSGPVGAGKTTAIGAVSDIPPVMTEVRADAMPDAKETTTVAMDYGVLDLGDVRVHLYGTPGQERFDFMWHLLAGGAAGVVLLMRNDRPQPLVDLSSFLDAFAPVISRTRLAVGVTGTDLARDPSLADYRRVLATAGMRVPLRAVDARRREDVSALIRVLLADDLDGRSGAHAMTPAG